MAPRNKYVRRTEAEANTSIWKEALYGAELLLLHASPVYYGWGVPQGDGSAVILIPGFLGTDHYLAELHAWLERIGYRPYLSEIGLNAECPNLLIQHRLSRTIEKALHDTGRKIHFIGHSLGGIIARSVACQRPGDVASVISLASPFRGTVTHQVILGAAEQIRKQILQEHGPRVLPDCYTARCTCEFLNHLRCDMNPAVAETAIYTQDDGVVDWRYCRTGNPDIDCEVPGTHIGLVFNSSVYAVIANRLAATCAQKNGNGIAPARKNGTVKVGKSGSVK
jgi:hypothetical protein